ncbi:MAG TPA: HAD-IA family hydrolase [Pseudonocardiaceae bacterium]|jgi:HAD superfamily hydrolase (TIGR01509 family)|nr:HAD-IA family hydrolase [Pseudonocardiaceae bacterium]
MPSTQPPAAPLPNGPDVPEREDPLRAVIFDLDGTLVDTERDGHRVAFNEAFEAAGLDYRWGVPEYGRLLTMAGGKRRLVHYLQAHGHTPAEAAELAAELHRDKTRRFVARIRTGAMQPRPGAAELISALHAEGVPMAIATTGTADWVLPLLDTLFGLEVFDVVVTRSDVTDLKPDPAAYLEALARLRLTPHGVLAVEDSANGVRAAVAAGLRCVAVVNGYTRHQDLSGAVAVLDDLARPEGITVLRGDPELHAGLSVAALRHLVTAAVPSC